MAASCQVFHKTLQAAPSFCLSDMLSELLQEGISSTCLRAVPASPAVGAQAVVHIPCHSVCTAGDAGNCAAWGRASHW